MMSSSEKIKGSQDRGRFFCINLDPNFDCIPKSLVKGKEKTAAAKYFGEYVIAATREYACMYKLNPAYYLNIPRGLEVLSGLVRFVRDHTAVPVILDGKFGDVGHTNRMYAEFVFAVLGADGVTLNPYVGREVLDPFFREDKLPFVLCGTSNKTPSMQEIVVDGKPLYVRVAEQFSGSSFVIGATKPEVLRGVIAAVGPDSFVLAPGIGFQGGDIPSFLGSVSGDVRKILPATSLREIFIENIDSDERNVTLKISERLERITAEVGSFMQ